MDWGDTFAVLGAVYGYPPWEVERLSYGQIRAYSTRAGAMQTRQGQALVQSLIPLVNSLFGK